MKVYLSRLGQRLPKYVSAMGPVQGLRYALLKAGEKLRIAPAETNVRARCLAHRLHVRLHGSSDPLVFEQICVERELDFLDLVSGPVRLIVDLGANIGCSSSFFLSAFPDASLLAVEPDPANAELCRRNLREWGPRATVVTGAVWHTSGALVLSRGTFGDGREWASQVHAARPGEAPDLIAYSVPDLLAELPVRQIDLLKIDIEGSELALFAQNSEQWLGSVRNICIELHGRECEAAFFRALSGFDYQTSRVGEHLLCLNLTPRPKTTDIG